MPDREPVDPSTDDPPAPDPAATTPTGTPRPAPAGTPVRTAVVRRAAPGRRRGGDGPVLPDITSDERDVGWGELPDRDDDERLLREVPPHHGG